MGKRREVNPFAAIHGVSGRNAPIADLLQMGKGRSYELGYVWQTPKEAQEHAALLRRQEFGVMKRRVYSGVKVQKQTGGHAVMAKESLGYLLWLRTGKG